MDAITGAWSAALVAIATTIAGAIATVVVKIFTNKQIDELSKRMLKVEISEEQCQESRKIDQAKLLASMERERTYREVMPQKMIDGIESIAAEAVKQTMHLEAQAETFKKFDKWGSDPSKMCQASMMEGRYEKLKQELIGQGHKLEHIELVLENLRAIDSTVQP